MFRTLLYSATLLAVFGCTGRTDTNPKEGMINSIDAKKHSAVVKTKNDGKDVDKAHPGEAS